MSKALAFWVCLCGITSCQNDGGLNELQTHQQLAGRLTTTIDLWRPSSAPSNQYVK